MQHAEQSSLTRLSKHHYPFRSGQVRQRPQQGSLLLLEDGRRVALYAYSDDGESDAMDTSSSHLQVSSLRPNEQMIGVLVERSN